MVGVYAIAIVWISLKIGTSALPNVWEEKIISNVRPHMKDITLNNVRMIYGLVVMAGFLWLHNSTYRMYSQSKR